jgi:hypothetical protein
VQRTPDFAREEFQRRVLDQYCPRCHANDARIHALIGKTWRACSYKLVVCAFGRKADNRATVSDFS